MTDVDGAISESVVFLEHFRDLPDPRQAGKVTYPLNEVLLLSLILTASQTHSDYTRALALRAGSMGISA
jgi:hypothetical protein